MYFPYLRGKQYEVLAVRASEFLSSNRIIPVFEPTTLSGSTHNRFRSIAESGVKFSVIVNSNNGILTPALPDIIKMINDLESHVPDIVLPAFEIRADQPVSAVQDFARQFASRQCVLVHRNHTHSTMVLEAAIAPFDRRAVHIFLDGGVPLQVVSTLPAAGRVLLRDGFSRCARNADYPNQSNFGDLLFSYKNREFDGFSDFSIIGDVYSPGGGAAQQVAIHLTECLDDTTIVTNHFVSRTPPQRGNDQAKYFSALRLLISHTGQPLSADFDTQGVREYHESDSHKHYPGLGKLKQWSMMHHMEIIDRKLEAMGTSSFV